MSLSKYQVQTTNILTIYNNLRNKTINLDVYYQRGEIWSTQKKIMLIDSLMKNYPINPIYFNVSDDEIMICMDGKQRLIAIRQFIGNCFPWMDENGNKLFFDNNDKDSDCGILTPEQRRRFEGITITTYNFNNLSQIDQLDIFRRIQEGVPLTLGEKMKGINSEQEKALSGMMKDFKTKMNNFFDEARDKHREIYIKLLYIVSEKKATNLTSLQMNKFLSEINDETFFENMAILSNIMDKFLTIITNSEVVYDVKLDIMLSCFQLFIREDVRELSNQIIVNIIKKGIETINDNKLVAKEKMSKDKLNKLYKIFDKEYEEYKDKMEQKIKEQNKKIVDKPKLIKKKKD
jgi:hypothetical protein